MRELENFARILQREGPQRCADVAGITASSWNSKNYGVLRGVGERSMQRHRDGDPFERESFAADLDVDVEISRRFPAETRGVLNKTDGNPLVPRENPRLTNRHAFSPTCNSASLKGTPHPPIPQYPSGFFARYCW